jgi:hypothetical protein
VIGTACNGTSAALGGAQVQANGKGYSFSLKTDPQGSYAFWAPAKSSPYTVIASKDGWIALVITKVKIQSGQTTTVNFNLSKLGC